MTDKNTVAIWMSVFLLATTVFSGAIFVGLAAADHSTNTLLDENVTVDANTDSVWVEATNTNNSDVHVYISGVDSDGNEELLQEDTFNSGSGETNWTEYSLSDSDRDSYDEIRIELEGDEAGSTDFGKEESIPEDELVNETVSINEDTHEVWIDLNNTGGADVRVLFEGIDSDGNADVLRDTTANATEDETASVFYALTDAEIEDYEDVRIVVEGGELESHDYGTVATISGGGTVSSDSWFFGETAGITNWVLSIIALTASVMIYKGSDDGY